MCYNSPKLQLEIFHWVLLLNLLISINVCYVLTLYTYEFNPKLNLETYLSTYSERKNFNLKVKEIPMLHKMILFSNKKYMIVKLNCTQAFTKKDATFLTESRNLLLACCTISSFIFTFLCAY